MKPLWRAATGDGATHTQLRRATQRAARRNGNLGVLRAGVVKPRVAGRPNRPAQEGASDQRPQRGGQPGPRGTGDAEAEEFEHWGIPFS